MAEGLLHQRIKEAQLESTLQVDSAATSRWEIGNPPHPGTQAIFHSKNIAFDSMRARQITQEDFQTADVIIGMDRQNVLDLKKIAPKTAQDKIHLFMSVVPTKETLDIADPYYTGDFEATYEMITEGLDYWWSYFLN